MKQTIFICILWWCGMIPAREAGTSIAVLDLDGDGITAEAAKTLTDRLRSELFSIGIFEVMEREKMNEMLQEQRLQASGVVSDRMMAEIGKVIGVCNMVAGSIGKLGSRYLLNLRLVNVEDGRITATASEECDCRLEELSRAMDKVALKLSGRGSRENTTVKYAEGPVSGAKGNFYIKSSPTAASVFLNGRRLKGLTPLIIEDIPSGRYDVRVESGDYAGGAPALVEDNNFTTVELALRKKTGRLRVKANIQGADVYIEGRHRGRTPLTLDSTEVGRFAVKVTANRYLESARTVVVTEGAETLMEALLEKPGAVKVLSLPLEADVYLDGEKRGVTPMVIADPPLGEHRLEVRKKGYADWGTVLNVDKPAETKIEPRLVPEGRPAPVKAVRTVEKSGNGLDTAVKWIVWTGGVLFVASFVSFQVM